MDVTLQTVERELAEVGGITQVLSTIGSAGSARVNSANIYVRLIEMEQRVFSLGRLWRAAREGDLRKAFAGNFSQREKMQEIRKRLAKYSDLRIAIRNQTSLRQGAPVDIDFAISGPDLRQLAKQPALIGEDGPDYEQDDEP